MDDTKQESGNDTQAAKDLIAANPAEFDGDKIANEAYARLINTTREDTIDRARKLFTKEFQTQNEIKKAKEALAKAEESLKKTQEKTAKLRAGDMSVLFEKS